MCDGQERRLTRTEATSCPISRRLTDRETAHKGRLALNHHPGQGMGRRRGFSSLIVQLGISLLWFWGTGDPKTAQTHVAPSTSPTPTQL